MRQAVRAGIVKLKHIDRQKRANGRSYKYFRIGKGPRFEAPDLPEDHPEFLRAYADFLADSAKPTSRAAPGSIRAACELAMMSKRAKALSKSYRAMLRRHFDAISEPAGNGPVRGLRERHIRADLNRSENQLDRLKAWRFLVRAMIEDGKLDTDPAANIRVSTAGGDGHTPWTLRDIEAYRERWPVGTVPRAAMELLFWTGARLGDSVMIGPQKVRGGILTYRQSKTGEDAHCPWTCPLPTYARDMAPDRQMMLAAIAPLAGHLTFLAAHGRTRSAKGLGTLIRESAEAAGLTGLSAHGLRKARAIALAEAGATPHQIAAWTGHKTLKEIERYTKKADRRRAVMGPEQEQNIPNESGNHSQIGGKS